MILNLWDFPSPSAARREFEKPASTPQEQEFNWRKVALGEKARLRVYYGEGLLQILKGSTIVELRVMHHGLATDDLFAREAVRVGSAVVSRLP